MSGRSSRYHLPHAQEDRRPKDNAGSDGMARRDEGHGCAGGQGREEAGAVGEDRREGQEDEDALTSARSHVAPQRLRRALTVLPLRQGGEAMNDGEPVLRREAVLGVDATADQRREFIKRVYTHLLVAVLAFVGLEYVLIHSSIARDMIDLTVVRGGRLGWLVVLVAFMIVGGVAERWARSSRSPG